MCSFDFILNLCSRKDKNTLADVVLCRPSIDRPSRFGVANELQKEVDWFSRVVANMFVEVCSENTMDMFRRTELMTISELLKSMSLIGRKLTYVIDQHRICRTSSR